MGRAIKLGATDQTTYVRIVDSTDGTPETGVTSATSGLALEYVRVGGTSTSIGTINDLANQNSTHNDAGIKHVGYGLYRVDMPDAACASGAVGVTIHGTVTGMVVVPVHHPLVAYDPQDTVRLGLTSLPNAAANATGGLGNFIIRGGTAVSVTSSTIVLDASASSVNDYYNGCIVRIVSATAGAGQERQIIDYDGATQTATIYAAGPPVQGSQWVTNPTGTIVFEIRGESIIPAAINVTSGVIQADAVKIGGQTASASGTVTFPNATLASTTNITGGTITTATNVTTVNGLASGVITATSIASAAITSAKFASGAIDATAIAADAIGASELAADAATEIADAILARNIAGGSSTGRTVGQALAAVRNKVTLVGTTLTVYETDDVTPLWTGTVTLATRDSLTAVDPA